MDIGCLGLISCTGLHAGAGGLDRAGAGAGAGRGRGACGRGRAGKRGCFLLLLATILLRSLPFAFMVASLRHVACLMNAAPVRPGTAAVSTAGHGCDGGNNRSGCAGSAGGCGAGAGSALGVGVDFRLSDGSTGRHGGIRDSSAGYGALDVDLDSDSWVNGGGRGRSQGGSAGGRARRRALAPAAGFTSLVAEDSADQIPKASAVASATTFMRHITRHTGRSHTCHHGHDGK